MNACGKAKEWIKALEAMLAFMASHGKLDDVSFGTAVDACSSQWHIALALLSDMSIRRMRASVITQNAAISSCEKAKQWTVALILLKDLQDLGDVISLQLRNKCLGKGFRISKGCWIIQWLEIFDASTYYGYLQCYHQCLWEKPRNGKLPWVCYVRRSRVAGGFCNVITFNAAISACEKSGEVKIALASLRELQMLHFQADLISYSASIGACDRTSSWRKALNLFFEAKSSQIEIGIVGCASAINACEKVAQWHQALYLMESSLPFTTLSVMNASISACEKGQASNEKNPNCLRYIGDDILPNHTGIITSHYKDLY